MKFNWGTGILITCIMIVLFCITAAVIFMNQKVELVSNNYYDKEILYQDKINILKHTRDLHADVNIEYADNLISLHFPLLPELKTRSGDILFFKPSGEKNDFKVVVSPDSNGNQTINSERMQKGYWKIAVDWQSNNTKFYSEKSILIN